jgi:hypothetical protein
VAVVETTKDLDEAYEAAQALQPLVEQMHRMDDEEARLEQLLAQFVTVIRCRHLRPLDQNQP